MGKTLLLTRPDSNATPESNSTVFEQTSGESVSGGGGENVNVSTQGNTQSSTTPEGFVGSFRASSTGDASETDSSIQVDPVSGKDPALTADNKAKVSLLRICISLIPRILPLFKEVELVEILSRLTIHVDDELRLIAFQTLKTFVLELPSWRRYVFPGFTGLILKEISDLHPKLVDNALKMLIQLINAWRSVLSSSIDESSFTTAQILFHLEGFSLFTLCHPLAQRRRYAHLILRECKSIGESTKCFRIYPHHNYAIDVLDSAAVFAMKQLHFQCFYSNLILENVKPDLSYLIEQSSSWETSINTASYNNNIETTSSVINNNSQSGGGSVVSGGGGGSGSGSFISIINKSARGGSEVSTETDIVSSNVLGLDESQLLSNAQLMTHRAFPSSTFTFDPWTECLAVFFSYDFVFTKCPQARGDAWAFIYARLQQLLPFVDPNEPHEVPRTSILFGGGANTLEKIRRAANERDANLNVWKNYLIGACCLTSGSDKYIYLRDYERVLTRIDDTSELNSNNPVRNFYLQLIKLFKNLSKKRNSTI